MLLFRILKELFQEWLDGLRAERLRKRQRQNKQKSIPMDERFRRNEGR